MNKIIDNEIRMLEIEGIKKLIDSKNLKTKTWLGTYVRVQHWLANSKKENYFSEESVRLACKEM